MKVEEHIEVSVPVRTAYNQWTQFASFPEFMDGVKRVDQIDDTTTHWVTDIGGVEREFDAVINSSAVGAHKPTKEYFAQACLAVGAPPAQVLLDRKSTRLNSSH